MTNPEKDPKPQPTFNEAIDDVLAQIRSDNQNTKRRHLRHEADGLILYIAKNYEPGKVPPQANFFPVRCRDLSCSGVSFFFPIQPSFQNLVFQLGNQDDGIYMESEVIHVCPIKNMPKEHFAFDSDGQQHKIHPNSQTFEVGCQFLRRIPVV